ncbi:protein ETHYLENE-INSENSITIVE 2-like isoform X3 [Ananas comosus]|uniref:Protein ETHYLENE-INSENSITIVE 2-like isoform X3 n=1 Tax=Ananas comosus TaxID=4615 RepID=A0A6P5EMM0_ANACO|nr:protein ETHYLENE-INSENSITIVE 2-like isoform X3 [Ananas comosus]
MHYLWLLTFYSNFHYIMSDSKIRRTPSVNIASALYPKMSALIGDLHVCEINTLAFRSQISLGNWIFVRRKASGGELASFKLFKSEMSGVKLQVFTIFQAELFLSLEYLDLGKWVAAIEAGAMLGTHLMILSVFINFTSIIFQYLASRIVMVTGRNLGEICSEEYSRLTCVILGGVAELSMIVSDLITFLTVAHGFQRLYGLSQFDCVLLSAILPLLSPFTWTLLGSFKESIYITISGFTLLFYLRGMLVNQLDVSPVTYAKHSGLNMETICSVTALLGSNIMPHYFFIYSAILQQQSRSTNFCTGKDVHKKLFTIIPNFSIIFSVNYMLMRSAAAAFGNTGHFMPTFQEAFMLMDQIFTSPTASSTFGVVFFISSLVTSVNRNLGQQVVLHNLFRIDLPVSIHHLIVKALATIPALLFLRSIGSANIYPLLLFFQVIVAILLPPSILPLLRISSSKSLMGVFKSSMLLEILLWLALLVIVATNIIFIVALLLGDSCWFSELSGFLYVTVLLLALTSLGFTIYLAFEPLASTKIRPEMQILKWATQNDQFDLPKSNEEKFVDNKNALYHDQAFAEQRKAENSLEIESGGPVLLSNLDQVNTVTGSEFDVKEWRDEPFVGDFVNEIARQSDEFKAPSERNEELEVFVRDKKAEDTRDIFKPFSIPIISPFGVNQSSNNARIKGNISGVVESKSTAATGLSRSGRRNLAAILDEFWAHIFDLHGNLTEKAKIIRADLLLGLDIKVLSAGKEASQKNLDSGTPNIDKSSVTESTGPYNDSSLVVVNVPLGYTRNIPTSPAVAKLKKLIRLSFLNGRGDQSEEELSEKILSLDKLAHEQAKNQNIPVVKSGGFYSLESKLNENFLSEPISPIVDSQPFWATQPLEGIFSTTILARKGERPGEFKRAFTPKVTFPFREAEGLVLFSLRVCFGKLLNLDGSDWLFAQKGGYDEELIDSVAAAEGFQPGMDKAWKGTEDEVVNLWLSIPNCGDKCVWQSHLVVSFGIWCIHRILELLIVENRPEFWGKYTYVLNRLQGILDPAFLKPRMFLAPCHCLNRAEMNVSWTESTGANFVLQMLKDVESAISGRRGRAGTAAGDVAFPKGKENVASVVKRYKRRLSKKPSGAN